MGTFTYQIPQLNFPNSTEDPKVATALQTVLTWGNGNIDSNNISSTAGITRSQLATGASYPNRLQIATSGTANANYGDFIICESTVTVNLPTPLSGAMVAVLSVAGGNGISLHTSGGAQMLINGTFTSTFTMTGNGKCYTFLSDGTNWILAMTNQNA